MKIKKVVGKKKSYLVHKKKYNQLLKEQKIKTKLFLATKHTAKEKKIFDEMLWKERRQYSMFENFRITKEINNLNRLDVKDAKIYKSNLNKLTTKTERVVSKLYDNNYRVNINRIYFGDGNDGYMTLGHLFSQFKTAIPTNTKEYQQVKQTVETALERLSKLKLSDTPYLKTAPLYLGDIKQYKYKKDGTVNLNSRENLKVF